MDISRRKLFGVGAAVAAVAAVPLVAQELEPKSKTVGPLLLERVCDGGRSEMTPEEINANFKSMIEYHGESILAKYPYFPGCGTQFQWYFSSGQCCCPTCGRCYLMTADMLKSGKYHART